MGRRPARGLPEEGIRLAVVPGSEPGIDAQKSLRTARPGLDGREVVELRHGARRRSEVAVRGAALLVELIAVQDVPLHPERVGESAVLQVPAEPIQTCRVEQLVPVDSENPGIRADVRLQLPVRRLRAGGALDLDVVELAFEPTEDLRRTVRDRWSRT